MTTRITPKTCAAAFAHKYGGRSVGHIAIFSGKSMADLRKLLHQNSYARGKKAGVYERTVIGIDLVLHLQHSTITNSPIIEFQYKGVTGGKEEIADAL